MTPPARLAIVGTRVLACPGDSERAAMWMRAAIMELQPEVVISGGAPGVDTLAEQAAASLGYEDYRVVVMRARVKRFEGFGGYRERNVKIAETCTHLLQIVCRQSKTYGSGWTADHAEKLGRVVRRKVVCPP